MRLAWYSVPLIRHRVRSLVNRSRRDRLNNLPQINAVISIKPLIIIMDIAKCDGIACEIKQSCLRYTMPIPDGDREWHYTQGDFADNKCSIFIPNGKSQCLTSSQQLSQRSRLSHGDYGYLIANGMIAE